MENVFAVLDEKEWTLGSPEGRETEDALDKINWYMDVISSKIRKALLSCYQRELRKKAQKGLMKELNKLFR